MSDRPTCIDCGITSPETSTNYTLISSTFGWRLTRRKMDAGQIVLEWRCASCWRKHKAGGDHRATGEATGIRRTVPGKRIGQK
jgi:hypothetical protein